MKPFPQLPHPQTPESAREWFWSHGICIAHWAKHHGFSRYSVFDLLRGTRKGDRGEGHHVAVALGIKPAPARSTKGVKP